ncbi:Protein CBG20333 [Caenorhabditis briggsae]|uniref:Protein CBG20333 n=1 Tax=Caenorhabditis briggsae TaxID=6238 RepID=A8XXK2_CAEBR|nr:Protein CBG20333 [Caenorhabditis briggsae]CAP37371.2 Protein CBG20333 [Caenorhabditis briggsae]
MKQRNFEILCAAMLGFGQLCIMVGYDSESFILESVIHSIHERDPEKVSQYAGYYCQAVIFCAYMTGCLFAPSILNVTTPKILLIFSAISYTLFPFGFLFFNTYFYFFTAILLGVGTSFYYLGMGSYLSQHSTRETIESNVSISWSVGCCCLMLGAGILAGITSLSVPEPTTVIQNSTFSADKVHIQHERRYKDCCQPRSLECQQSQLSHLQ